MLANLESKNFLLKTFHMILTTNLYTLSEIPQLHAKFSQISRLEDSKSVFYNFVSVDEQQCKQSFLHAKLKI